MANLHLTLSDDLHAQLLRRAQESGFASIEAYAEALLSASAEAQVVDEELESLLVERLNDARPGIELTPQFKQQFRDDIQRRRGASGAGTEAQ